MTPEQKELIHEGEELERKLSNGSRGDPGTMSDAIRYLIRTNRIQLHAELVSDKECRQRMSLCPGIKTRSAPWTWSKTTAVLGTVAMLVGLALKLWG